jgi:hypothetical protein
MLCKCFLLQNAGLFSGLFYAFDQTTWLTGTTEVCDALISGDHRNGRATARAGKISLHVNRHELTRFLVDVLLHTSSDLVNGCE